MHATSVAPEDMPSIPPRLSHDLRFVLTLMFASRLALTIVGVVSRLLLQPLRSGPYPWDYSKRIWLSIWGVWDSGWYIDVAVRGYSALQRTDPEILNQANYAFFPLYPLLMRFLGPAVGGVFNAGILVSNLCLICACILLIRLLELDFDSATARRAVTYMICFPTGFILSGVFSEALFLFLMVLAFYSIRRDHFLLAGVAGLLASMTRSVGVLLVVPLAVQYLRQRHDGRRQHGWRPLALLLAPCGLLIFSAYNYVLTGNPLAFARIQTSWQRTLQSPLKVLWSGMTSGDVNDGFSAWITGIALLVLALGARRLGPAYLLLSALLVLTPLATGLLSMPRFLVIVFPLPLVMALWAKDPPSDRCLLVSLSVLQGGLMAFWANGFKLVV